jgi:hypothetical protein
MMTDMIYSLFGALVGTFVTTLYFRIVILPRERRHRFYEKGIKNMKEKKNQTKKQVKHLPQPLVIYAPENRLAARALYDMDEIIEESDRIYKKTEDLKNSVRAKLLARTQQDQ